MKNWVLRYSILPLVVILLTACYRDNNTIDEINVNRSVFILTDSKTTDFNISSNDVFSSFIKDLIFDPIFNIDVNSYKVNSRIVKKYNWLNESELELTINKSISFHDSPIFSMGKGKIIDPNDFIFSINTFAKENKYSIFRGFFENFQKMVRKDDKTIVIYLKKNVTADDFITTLASFNIPLLPYESKNPNQFKNLIGTGLYAVESVSNNHLYLKVFKNHYLYKKQKKQFLLPERYAISLQVNPKELIQRFINGNADGILTSDIWDLKDYFTKSVTPPGKIITRKDDYITLGCFNFSNVISSSLEDMDKIKSCLDPEGFVNQNIKRGLIAGYSKYSLNDYSNSKINNLSVDFDNVSLPYQNFIQSNLFSDSISIHQQISNPDCIIYQINIPSSNHWVIEKAESIYNANKKLLADEKTVRDANFILLQPVKYIVFGSQIQYKNTKFEKENVFGSLYKIEK